MRFRSHIRVPFAVCVALFLVGISAGSQQRTPGKAKVSGLVRHIRTGEPIVGAQVTLTDGNVTTTQRPVPIAAINTNNRGEFAFDSVDSGVYKVVVMTGGFVRRDSKKIELTAGQAIDDIFLSMTPTAAISGRVSNLSGQPLAGISISLQRKAYSANGTIIYSTVFSARTNDLGEYRMYWVAPGNYYVAAEGSDGGIFRNDDRYVYDDAVRRGRNDLAEVYSAIYFPNERDLSRATLIDLKEGTDLRGIDFNLVRQPRQLFSVRGRVIDSTSGKVPPQASLNLYGNGGSRFASADAAGTFEFRNLGPGQYTLAGRADNIRFGPVPSGPPSGVPWTSMTVTIDNSNLEDLALTLERYPVIAGRLKIEGQLPAGTGLDRLRINLVPEPSFTRLEGIGNPSGTPRADGTFTLTSVPDGTFRVGVSGLPTGFYLKDARLDGADILYAYSRISGPGNLDVVISANAGVVEGRVVNGKSVPVADIETVLVPDDLKSRSYLLKKAVTDKNGKFIITGIVPGDYKLLSWESLESNSYFDPEVLRKFETKGTPVHITESSRQTVEVVVIPEEVSP